MPKRYLYIIKVTKCIDCGKKIYYYFRKKKLRCRECQRKRRKEYFSTLAGHRGKSKTVGTIKERDLDIIMVDGKPRVRGAVKLEKQRKKK